MGWARAEEFLLAIAAADVALPDWQGLRAAMREVLRQFEISAPLDEVIDRHFWIEVRPPMLDAVRAVRDLGLRCGLATNQQNLRGAYMRSSLGFETIFDEQFYSFELGFAKPEAGYFQAIMDRIAVPPTGCCSSMIMMATSPAPARSGSTATLSVDGGVAALTPILARYGIRL